METRAAAIRAGNGPRTGLAARTSALVHRRDQRRPGRIVQPLGFPVYAAGRGGRYTYHGPGQRVGYLVLDLERRGRDIRCFVHALEGWMIAALARARRRSARREPGRIGIWTGAGPNEAKIGAIGVRVKRWVTMHGFSINVAPDLVALRRNRSLRNIRIWGDKPRAIGQRNAMTRSMTR